jgi:hypothetical protein
LQAHLDADDGIGACAEQIGLPRHGDTNAIAARRAATAAAASPSFGKRPQL